jgi:hypothetical protein
MPHNPNVPAFGKSKALARGVFQLVSASDLIAGTIGIEIAEIAFDKVLHVRIAATNNWRQRFSGADWGHQFLSASGYTPAFLSEANFNFCVAYSRSASALRSQL